MPGTINGRPRRTRSPNKEKLPDVTTPEEVPEEGREYTDEELEQADALTPEALHVAQSDDAAAEHRRNGGKGTARPWSRDARNVYETSRRFWPIGIIDVFIVKQVSPNAPKSAGRLSVGTFSIETQARTYDEFLHKVKELHHNLTLEGRVNGDETYFWTYYENGKIPRSNGEIFLDAVRPQAAQPQPSPVVPPSPPQPVSYGSVSGFGGFPQPFAYGAPPPQPTSSNNDPPEWAKQIMTMLRPAPPSVMGPGVTPDVLAQITQQQTDLIKQLLERVNPNQAAQQPQTTQQPQPQPQPQQQPYQVAAAPQHEAYGYRAPMSHQQHQAAVAPQHEAHGMTSYGQPPTSYGQPPTSYGQYGVPSAPAASSPIGEELLRLQMEVARLAGELAATRNVPPPPQPTVTLAPPQQSVTSQMQSAIGTVTDALRTVVQTRDMFTQMAPKLGVAVGPEGAAPTQPAVGKPDLPMETVETPGWRFAFVRVPGEKTPVPADALTTAMVNMDHLKDFGKALFGNASEVLDKKRDSDLRLLEEQRKAQEAASRMRVQEAEARAKAQQDYNEAMERQNTILQQRLALITSANERGLDLERMEAVVQATAQAAVQQVQQQQVVTASGTPVTSPVAQVPTTPVAPASSSPPPVFQKRGLLGGLRL